MGASLRLGARAGRRGRQPARAGSVLDHGSRGTPPGHAPVRNDGLWSAAAGDRARSRSEGNQRACAQRAADRPRPASRTRVLACVPPAMVGLLARKSAVRADPVRWLPCLPQLRDNRGYSVPAASALPDPAEPRFGIRVRLPVLAVTPGSAGAFLVVLTAAGQADHAFIVPCREGQAAFALRIRRRRSADRSSSLSPPQVPYFSGRLTA